MHRQFPGTEALIYDDLGLATDRKSKHEEAPMRSLALAVDLNINSGNHTLNHLQSFNINLPFVLKGRIGGAPLAVLVCNKH
ncbi:hypothetical protein C0081_10590 [Cohaesibacter celericrescens]|uniref:Uncharacterized protein n=1 Tax=Cohaesibacter celericrescens TaxID=2067669 RepID=A0A2N5XRZ6_9HYPH|nr:hypothetical protein C0081_10590 [Cohaesibacter celericrescens]